MYALSAALVLLLPTGLGGCGDADAPYAGPPESAQATPDRYTVRGVIRQLPADGNDLRVEHEAIPDFRSAGGEIVGMGAMVMPFPLAEGVGLGDLQPGDKVEIVLEVNWTGVRPYQATSVVPIDPQTPLELVAPHADH